MSAISKENRKRKRENEVKKWTEEDIKKVLNYMQAHRQVEKPTARLYYIKLLAETKIEATWNMLKCKVRHLKGTLQKAEAWSKFTGAGVEDGDDAITVKDKILNICPHYEQLSDIFSTTKAFEVVVMDTSSDATDIEDDSFVVSDERTTSSVFNMFAHKVKRRTQNTCFEWLASIETERTKFQEKQLQLETEKFEWAKEVENKKLEMERVKLENEFQLRKLEQEQNERIKMFEIQMKFKNEK